MSRLAWYWHRVGAMDAAEILARLKKKLCESTDARRGRDWTSISIPPGRRYPSLPDPKRAPDDVRSALQRDAGDILAGRWRAFGHLPIRVSDPPDWHKDHLAGVDLTTNRPAFDLDHRSLPRGADVKLIWELSRWYQLTRLAMAAFILDDANAAWKCIHWLEHWVQHNPPYRGWNWTSALEAGMRLIQFTWIDALLQRFVSRGECEAELEQLRYEILPSHAWFTWRHKSFGSSANNHSLGELAGLILATVRWPELAPWSAPLDELQSIWEREILAQFAHDGGNREQALHYHLFSFELCSQALAALRAAGRRAATEVTERLEKAADFFVVVHGCREPWDYGDSDDAVVVPVCAADSNPATESAKWMRGATNVISYWMGESPSRTVSPAKCIIRDSISAGEAARAPSTVQSSSWRVFDQSGIVMLEHGEMTLRWDVSALGYLTTAAHGHLDALHVAVWLGDTAMIVDPGTGAYYANSGLRTWLASRRAHNGPCVE
ncbi:MAG: heparinase II/III family protein, partial [Verrucomicrobia subdivision 3 bacterium]|nr:heparinase II/III family protein [Limisphaerales bacterium]